MTKEKLYTYLNKNDPWDDLTFYTIGFNKRINKKYLQLNSVTTREFGENSYADWCYAYYPDVLGELLDKLLEWNDIYYGIEKYIFNKNNYDLYQSGDLVICNPQECFNEVNKMLNANNTQGCTYKLLTEITDDTPCGYYFTIG